MAVANGFAVFTNKIKEGELFNTDKNTIRGFFLLLVFLILLTTPLIWHALGLNAPNTDWGKMVKTPALPIFLLFVFFITSITLQVTAAQRSEWQLFFGGLIVGVGLTIGLLSSIPTIGLAMIPVGLTLTKAGWSTRRPKPEGQITSD